MGKSFFLLANVLAILVIHWISADAVAQFQYPTTGQAGFKPRNSQWATSQPNVIDQPGLNAYEPTGFPAVNEDDLNDISMSPDDWEQSGTTRLPDGDLDRPGFVTQFPDEHFDNQSIAIQPAQRAREQESENNFLPISKPTTTNSFGGMIPLPPSSEYGRIKNEQQEILNNGTASGYPPGRYPLELNAPANLQRHSQPIPIPVPRPSSVAPGNSYPTQDIPLSAPYSNHPSPTLYSNYPVPDGFQYPIENTPTLSTFGWPQDQANPVFRPDLGHRTDSLTQRAGAADTGGTFDFEDKDKEYPPMREILATGTYFASLEFHLLKPYFQNNNAIASTTGASTRVQAFDSGFSVAPAFRAGFESKYGPGLEVTFAQYDQTSRDAVFASDGFTTGQISAWLPATNQLSQLSATNVGDQLNANHSLDVQLIGVSFFKEMKFPISRLNGIFGLQHASIQHRMDSRLSNGGSALGTLTSHSDMKAFGPRVAFEYYRPIGHTKMTLVTKFAGSLLLGNRDQFVQNSLTGDTSRIGSDEMVTMFNFGTAIMYKKPLGERRFLYAKIGYDVQSWLGGGNATEPQNDFGFRGGVFAIGINR